MSFKDLKKQSSLGSLTSKLVKEVEKMNTGGGGDDRLWKPELDKTGKVMPFSVFYQHQKVKIFLGQRFIPMHFKDQVDGILKTL